MDSNRSRISPQFAAFNRDDLPAELTTASRWITAHMESRKATVDNQNCTNQRDTVCPHFANREYARIKQRNSQPALVERSPTCDELPDNLTRTAAATSYEARLPSYAPSASRRTVSRNFRDLSIVSGRSWPIADCSIIA